MNNRNTVANAHERIDGLEKEVIAMQTLMLESIMIAAAASIIGLLVAVLMKM